MKIGKIAILIGFILMPIVGFGEATLLDTVIEVDMSNSDWQNTGIDIQSGDRLYLFCQRSGYIATDRTIGALTSFHGTNSTAGTCSPASNLLQGPVVEIGSGTPLGLGQMGLAGWSPSDIGSLYLGYNDDAHWDNSGTLYVGVLRLRGFTGVKEAKSVSKNMSLQQNKPNPVSSTTAIEYNISKKSHVCLEIYNETGQLVKTLCNEEMKEGTHTAIWNRITTEGKKAPSGNYFYTLKVDNKTMTKKAIIIQ